MGALKGTGGEPHGVSHKSQSTLEQHNQTEGVNTIDSTSGT